MCDGLVVLRMGGGGACRNLREKGVEVYGRQEESDDRKRDSQGGGKRQK